MYSNIFNVDFFKLIQLLLPPLFRKDNQSKWLQCLAAPIKTIYADFINNRINNIYKTAHNGQVCYLRKVLNDTFDNELRRILIIDGSIYQSQYIYTNGENQKNYLGKIFLRPAEEYGDAAVDFRVIIPEGFNLTANYYQMKAIIDFYKLTSKRYKIHLENE